MDILLNSPLTWLLPILLPVAVAVVLLRPRGRNVAEALAPWTALPALLLAILPQASRSVDVPWLLLGSRLGLDETSRVFLFFTALLWLICGLFATGYLAEDPRRHRFQFFFLLTMSGNFGLILAQDVVGFYTYFALMSFASYGLVVHHRDPQALRAGRVYIVFVVIGELLLFSGLILGASSTGSILWDGFGDRLADSPAFPAAMGLLFFGLGVKAGALPLHVWLPVAHPAAPVPASAVLSGAMIKAGLIGWLRLMPSDPAPIWIDWGELCILLGSAAAFYGAAIGILQSNPKTVLAYSSISQMGLMTIGVGLILLYPSDSSVTMTAVLVYAMHHALAKGALFLGVGVARTTRGATWQRCLCGLGLLLPALALAGSPLTSGALAKGVLKSSAGEITGVWHDAIVMLLPAAAVATTLILARFIWVVWPTPDSSQAKGPPLRVWLSWTVLLAAVMFGVFAWPWAQDISVAKLILSPKKMLATLWPVVLGVGIAGTIGLASTRGFRLHFPVIPAGDLLEVFFWLATRISGICRSIGESCSAWRWPRPQLGEAMAATIARWIDLSRHPEEACRRGPVFGVMLLLLAGLMLGLLAWH